MRIGFLALGVAALGAVGVRADNLDNDLRGVFRTVSFQAESKDNSQFDASRFSFTSNFKWETGRRETIDVTVPYQWIEVFNKRAGRSNTAEGLKDIKLNYTFRVRDLARSGMTTRWELRTNLPVGKDSLNAEENRAVTQLVQAGEGFLAPQFGLGFGAGIRHYWTWEKGTSRTEIYAGTMQNFHYTVSRIGAQTNTNTGVDTYEVGYKRHLEKGRRKFDFGVDALFFGESESNNNGTVTQIDSDPNFLFTFTLQNDHTERIFGRFNVVYQMRDQQDSLQPGVIVNPRSLLLGDKIFWDFTLNKKSNPHSTWKAGFSGIRTFGAEQNGQTVANTSSSEVFFRVGYDRSRDNGSGWNIQTDIGLTSYARDLAILAAYYRSF